MINKKMAVIFTVFAFLLTALNGQEKAENKVLYLTGRIDTATKMTMYAVSTNEYFEGRMLMDGFTDYLSASGEVFKNKVSFKIQTRENKVLGTFEGEWKGNQLSGTYFAEGSLTEKSFYLDSGLFPGYWTWSVYALENSRRLFDADDAPQASMSLFLVYPDKGPDSKSLASLRDVLDKLYLGEILPKKPVAERMKAYAEFYFQDYLKLFDEYDEGALLQNFSYSASTFSKIYYAGENYLSLTIDDYSYTGGAHGLPALSALNFDLKNGKVLKLEDVLGAKAISALPEKIRSQLLAQAGADLNDSLSDWGYFVDEVPLPNTFAIDAKGITIIYNVYEIAPYAAGVTNVFFPWKVFEGQTKISVK